MNIFKEIAQGVFHIYAGRSNVYMLAGDELTLVDTGLPGEEKVVFETIKKIGRNVRELHHILITHAHMDHIGSLAAIKEESNAKVVASIEEIAFIQGKKKTWRMNREGFRGKLFKAALFFMERYKFYYKPTDVDIACRGGEIIPCFGGIQVLATPGHSPGSLSYYQQEKKLLFTGDALSGVSGIKTPPRMGCANYAMAIKSVEKLSHLDSEICCFGHGDPVLGNAHTIIMQIFQQRSQI